MISSYRKEGTIHILLQSSVNKLSQSFSLKLAEHLKEADSDKHCKVIVVSSENPKAFCVGAAIDELISLDPNAIDLWLAPWEVVSTLSKPIIMALDGYVLGGGLEIAMMGDILITTDRALMGQPEIKLALLPGCGGTLRLTELIGYHRSFEMCATGEIISAQKAYEWGLVNTIVKPDELLSKAFDIAKKIEALSGPAIQSIKRILKNLYDSNTPHTHHLQKEREAFKNLFLRKDAHEGMTAFSHNRASA